MFMKLHLISLSFVSVKGFCIILSIETVADMFSPSFRSFRSSLSSPLWKTHQLPSLPQSPRAPLGLRKIMGLVVVPQYMGVAPGKRRMLWPYFWPKNPDSKLNVEKQVFLPGFRRSPILIPHLPRTPGDSKTEVPGLPRSPKGYSRTPAGSGGRGNRKCWVVNFDPSLATFYLSQTQTRPL